jgi:putative ABC transport system ATP-binding protein
MTIVATGVVKSYRTRAETIHALRGIDLTIATGEMLAVVGPSGSGKTTMLNCLSGLDHPDAGQVVVDGVDLAALAAGERRDYRAAAMGFLFQGSALLAALTAEENVELPLLIGRRRRRPRLHDTRAAARTMLERLGVGDRGHHRPEQLSGGERQRVALARAMVTRPAILWADEPTANLDTETSNGVMAVIGELHRDGLTVVVVTHDPTVAAAADRKVEVRDGLLKGAPGAERTPGRTR